MFNANVKTDEQVVMVCVLINIQNLARAHHQERVIPILRLRLHGRGFQSKRFHDLETASKTRLRESAKFVPDRFQIDAVSPFTRPMKPYRFENAPLLKAF